ncbi:MAG: hypothetical protein NWP98_06030 [Erythrobacter sp.]|nr:hypothetical protein [Erythrobacter sp.]
MHRAMFPLLCLMLAACAPAQPERSADTRLIATDPVLARALGDPLMSDPDLASRNEANAAVGFADSSALPVLSATSSQRQAARDAARLELLEGGPIPELPEARADPGGKALGPLAGPADLLAALGAPETCAARLREDFGLAADLPAVASVMPQAMVVQAGGADSAPCRIRIIRYHTAAAPQDVLQYHYTRARRAGLRAGRHTLPEDIIAATGKRGESLVVHVRPGMNGFSSVDLLYRAP